MEGGDEMLTCGVTEESEHKGGKVVRIIVAEEKTSVDFIEEVHPYHFLRPFLDSVQSLFVLV